MNDEVVLSREQLYELVWSTPIHRLAKDFGISDVALGKTCRRMNVPPPPRGYWACIAAGQKPKRTPLPKAKARQRMTIVLTKREKPAMPMEPPEPIEIPKIVVLSSFDSPHPVVKHLGKLMKSAAVDEHDRLRIPGLGSPLILISVALHRRCLLLLDALAKTLVERGHSIALKSSEKNGETSWRIAIVVDGDETGLSFTEKIERHPHAMTAEEKKKVKDGQTWGVPKYDYLPSGKIELNIQEGAYPKRTYRDSDARLLDHRLGSAVVEIERFSKDRKVHAKEVKRRQAEQQEAERFRQVELEAAERKRREEEAKRRHNEALTQELERKASQWHRAEQMRAFLAAVQRSLPETENDEVFAEWLDWAERYVRAIDPLENSQTVARPTTPSPVS